MTIKKPLTPELHSTIPALVSPLPQVDMAHMGVQVLLLVESHTTHLALKGFVPRVNSPMVDKLKMSGKFLSTFSTSPGSLTAVN